MSVGHQPKV